MGYYTEYRLEVADLKGHGVDELDTAITEMNSTFEFDGFVSDEHTSLWENTRDTWYDHEEDMAALSARFPKVLFTLHGAGENVDDRWKKYFMGGLIQRAPAQIAFDEFDEAKLCSIQEESGSE